MNILALETSAKAASCAYSSGGKLVAESFTNAGLTHSQTVMPMVRGLLDCARVPLSDVDVFAAVSGPGSFTGLRIGIAAVKGMAMGLGDKPCVGVSALEALAENLACFPGYVIPAMDARRAQVYAAIFRYGGEVPERVSEDEAVSIGDLLPKLLALGSAPMILVGDGAELCRRELAGQIPGLLLAPEHLRHQRAASVCAVAIRMAREGKLVSAGTLAPFYLRMPQAERELLEKKAQKHPTGLITE